MNDITTGIIDPISLGCTTEACNVFALHAMGVTVPQIAAKAHLSENAVRGLIAGVWKDDKASMKKRRMLLRDEDWMDE